MQIEITGNRCVSCCEFIQYYGRNYYREYVPIDCGYCVKRQRRTRPGDRCKDYSEAGNASAPIGAIKSYTQAG